jgi:DNA polymerase-3 subunit epsilon
MSIPWHLQPMVAFDLETTGPHPDTARIVTATIIEVSSSGMGNVYEWLVDPGMEIPAGATAIHGITTERAQEDGQDPAEAIMEITELLSFTLARGIPVVGQNISYDLTVLDRECRRHGIRTLGDRLDRVAPIIDTYVLDKQVDQFRKGKRTLTAMAAHYGVNLADAHTASADALAASRIAVVMAEWYAELRVDADRLHRSQVDWRFEQCKSLQEYFRRTDPTAIVNGDWPVQQLPNDWTPQLVDVEEVTA